MKACYRNVALAALLGTALAGCARPGARAYEERIRIFYALEDGMVAAPGDSVDEISTKYLPTATVNRAFEQLNADGFVLVEVRPLPAQDRATMFRFARPLPSAARPSRAPSEYTGLYLVNDGQADNPTYYVLTPRYEGYRVHILGGEGHRTAIADWNPGSKDLQWQEGDMLNRLTVSRNGRTLVRQIDSLGGAERARAHRIEAMRVDQLD